MPWQGSAPNKSFTRSNGTHSGSSSWAEDEAAGTGITSARHDVHDEDLADAIDATLMKDGGNKMVGLIDAGGFGFSNLATLGSAAEATIASSSTTDLLGSAALFCLISGTTTITSLGTGTNRVKVARFSGALTLTHNATSLILPGGANIVTAAGDVMIVVSDGSSNARVVSYQRAADVPGYGSARASFRAYRASDQNVTINPTKVAWDSESFDVGSYFGSSKWTPPAGTVMLGALIRFSAVTADAHCAVYIYKNGSVVASSPGHISSTTSLGVFLSYIDQASGSDYYEVFVGSTDTSVDVLGSAIFSQFWGTMI